MAAHVHDFIELAVITRGQATHHSSAGTAAVVPGNVIVMSPGEWHEYSKANSLVVRNVLIGSELFSRELAWVRKQPEVSGLLWPPAARLSSSMRKLELTSTAESRVQRTLDSLEGESSGDQALNRIGNLLLLLAELVPTSGLDTPPVPDTVLRVVGVLEDNLAHPWTLADLTAIAGVSTSTLTRLFRTSLGMSPLASLAALRAEKAASLLIETDLPVSEIGIQVGWPDPAYMSRRFSALMGASPSRYRDPNHGGQ